MYGGADRPGPGARVLFISRECMDYGPATLPSPLSLRSSVTLRIHEHRFLSLSPSHSIPRFHLPILHPPWRNIPPVLRGSRSCFLSILENRRDLKSRKRALSRYLFFLFVFSPFVLPTSAERPIFRAIRASVLRARRSARNCLKIVHER